MAPKQTLGADKSQYETQKGQKVIEVVQHPIMLVCNLHCLLKTFILHSC